MQQATAILYYFHDPMCSWCWGFKSTFQKLVENLPGGVNVKRILGGLAPDSDDAMPQPMRDQIIKNWQTIESTIPGVKFNFDFWHKCLPRRSTYAACRAVIAARQQGERYDELMTAAIQKAYYQQARNPSDDETLIELAVETGLNRQKFIDDFYDDQASLQLQKEIAFSREMYVESFPSLVLEKNSEQVVINIDYNDYQVMLRQVENRLNS